jgi:primosomal protein N' (replication factor Y)
MNNKVFADVLVPRRLDFPLTYHVPPGLRSQVCVGSRVLAPLGPRHVEGVIVEFRESPPGSRTSGNRSAPVLRDLLGLVGAPSDTLPEDVLAVIKWVAERYVTSLGQALRVVLPTPHRPLSPRKPRKAAAPAAPPAVPAVPPAPPTPVTPSTPISVGWEPFHAALQTPQSAVFLLHGSPGQRMSSLLQAAGAVLARGRSVLLLVPETARASLLYAQSAELWGDAVAFWHRGLTLPMRDQIWQHVRTNEIRAVVGTRSAVFLPMHALGLIGLDEEESASFKEEQAPHYHARDVALMRARQQHAMVLLASAHPSVETAAGSDLVRLPPIETPGHPAPSPRIDLLDLRQLQRPYGRLLTDPLIAALRSAIEAKAGACLFLNRKGYAPALHCRACGQGVQCPNCSVTMTFYRRPPRQICHYCGESSPVPDACPACHGTKLAPSGFGTEHLEEEVHRLFPAARILRLDRDTARTPEAAETLRRKISGDRFDVIVGTQMLFQGSSLPQVGLVGIPYADAGLHRPDYRSAEHTYHSLLDAAALARPGNQGGSVLIQTYMPTHHAIRAVALNEPAHFYDHEVTARRTLGYPPFMHLISLRVSGRVERAVQRAARRWAELLTIAAAAASDAAEAMVILGPVPAPVSRLRGRFRWQMLVKAQDAAAARQAVRASLVRLRESRGKMRIAPGLKFEADVDPVDMG